MENLPVLNSDSTSESLSPILSRKADGSYLVSTITSHQKEVADYFLDNGLSIAETIKRFALPEETVRIILKIPVVLEYVQRQLTYIAQETDLSTRKIMAKLNEVIDGAHVDNNAMKALDLAARITNMVKPAVLAIQINNNPLSELDDDTLDARVTERLESSETDKKNAATHQQKRETGVAGREGQKRE